MQSAVDIAKTLSYVKEPRECAKHGAFECTVTTLGKRTFESDCPVCTRQRDDERERAEKEARREAYVERLLARVGVPPRFADATLANYQPTTERAEKVHAACRRYVETWPERFEKGSSLILSGDVGTGKTHLACAIAKALVNKHQASAHYTTVLRAIQRVRSTYGQGAGETEQDVLDHLSSVDLLILDEVGMQSGSNHEHNTLFEILNRRYENVLPTIVISNLGIKELVDAIGDRLVDRLKEHGAVLAFKWESHRGAA